MLSSWQRSARDSGLAGYAVGCLIFAASAALSYRRQLHVDEFEALYSGQLAAVFHRGDFGLPIEVSLVVFSTLARRLTASVDVFVATRWLGLALLFCLCFALSRVQRVLPSANGRACVFLSAVLFGPLWRHGFEFRHDIYLAGEVVLIGWAAERARLGPLSWRAALVFGFGAALAQGTTFKAFTIWVPGFVFCAWLAAREAPRRVRTFVAQLSRYGAGLVLGGLLVAAVFAQTGVLAEYWRYHRDFVAISSTPAYRLSCLPLLTFMIARAPLHACFTLLGLGGVMWRLLRRQALGDALVPAALFSLSLLSLFSNPTPFPYNLTWLASGVVWISAVGMSFAWEGLTRRTRPVLARLFVAFTGVGAAFSFVACELDPFYRKNWDDQLRMLNAVEALTTRDEPVLDLCGFAISRPPVGKDWLVHSLLMPAYHAGKRETVQHIIERVWPPVAVVAHYRWGWLDAADFTTLRQHYLRFTGGIWALGSVLDPRTQTFEIHRAGRYWARTEGELGSVDGTELRGGTVRWLAQGNHLVHAMKRFELIWIGPAMPPGPALFEVPLFGPAALPGQ